MSTLRFGRYDYAVFLSFIAYAASSMAIPMVLYLLADEMSFPLEDGGCGLGGALQIGRSIPMVFAMLFCGFLAARTGKAVSLGLAMLCMGTGIVLASFSPGYLFLLISLAFAGLGEGVCEGIATPIIQDRHPREPGRYINFTHGFWSVGVLGTVLLMGWLLQQQVSWRTLVFAAGLLALPPAVLLLLPDRHQARRNARDRMNSEEVLRRTGVILRTPRFWLFFAAMFFAGGGEFCLTFWAASYIRMEFAGATMFLAGIGTACFAGGMIIGRMAPGYLIRQKQLPHLVIGTAAAAALLSLFFPFVQSLTLFFPLLFFIGIAVGPFWPSIQSYCADRMTVDNTMLFVLLSCAGIPGCGVFTALMGVAGDLCGMRASMFLATFCFVCMGLLILEDYLSARKEVQRDGAAG